MAMKFTNFQRTLALGQIRAGIRHRDVDQAFHVDVRTIRAIQVQYNQTNDVKHSLRQALVRHPKVITRTEENRKLVSSMAVLFA